MSKSNSKFLISFWHGMAAHVEVEKRGMPRDFGCVEIKQAVENLLKNCDYFNKTKQKGGDKDNVVDHMKKEAK